MDGGWGPHAHGHCSYGLVRSAAAAAGEAKPKDPAAGRKPQRKKHFFNFSSTKKSYFYFN
jgi:hypothetical protein